MPKKENPAPLADSGGRAGASIAVQRRYARDTLQNQEQRRLRRQHLAEHAIGFAFEAAFLGSDQAREAVVVAP